MNFYLLKSGSIINSFILFNLALYIVLFQIQNVNIFWILNNAIINIIILFINKKYNKKFFLLYFFIIAALLFTIFYPSIKISSFSLTIYLIISAALQLNFLYNYINYNNYYKILVKIFYVFFVSYFIQCFCVVLHIPIFNGFGLTKENTTIFRLNAFSPEPSMASQLILLILYLVNITNYLKKNHRIIFEILALLLLILFGSVFGYISLLIYLIVIHRKKYRSLFKIELIIGILFIIYFLNSSETLSRIFSLTNYLLTEFDIDKLAAIEPSGSFRFYPLLFYFQKFDIHNIYYIIGFGPGVSTTFFNEGLISSGYGLDLDSNFQGGFLPSFLIDYGIVLTIILIYFIFKNCIIKHNLFEYSFLFLLLINTNINTQLFWFYIFTTFVAKHFYFQNVYINNYKLLNE
jgi:hypothetical protein